MGDGLYRRLGAFTRLSDDDKIALERLSRKSIRTVDARRDLIREGEHPRVIYVMLSGWACRYKTLPDGRRQVVSYFIPGDPCDLNVYVLKEMDHSVGAITPIKVGEITRDEFEQVVGARPRLSQALWCGELVAMATQREWTLNVGQRTAYERLCHLMVEMYLRLESVGMAADGRLDWPLTQNDLADATSLTPVHVNRTLQLMRKEGLIELAHRQLVIPDLNRLKAAAMFNDNYLHLNREGAHPDAC